LFATWWENEGIRIRDLCFTSLANLTIRNSRDLGDVEGSFAERVEARDSVELELELRRFNIGLGRKPTEDVLPFAFNLTTFTPLVAPSFPPPPPLRTTDPPPSSLSGSSSIDLDINTHAAGAHSAEEPPAHLRSNKLCGCVVSR
jgi:hypothetical protein